ncbi:hypothetical protein RJT34_31637 [Clitoria ternatea]|uniref:Cytochrome P450 n=1 Tax=Clitoria ternatea TaxID=43366 RepID=A0AAN9EWR7_CLITE
MEEAGLVLSTIIFLLLILSLYSKFTKQKKQRRNLPPSPPSLPLIGHLHLIKREPLQRTLHNLTQKYGHIFFLRLGTRNVLVVSSPSAVEECFTKNDITFANRPRTLAGKHLSYDNTAMGFASYGDHWRNLRRLTTLELLSSNRLAKFSKVREEEVKLLIKQLYEDCRGRQKEASKVELRARLVELSFNMMLRMITGKRYYGKHAVAEEGKEFQVVMKEMAELNESGNLNDFFPMLQWIDFQGVEKRMVKVKKKMDSFFQKLLDEHRRATNGRRDNMTLIDVMLELQENEPEFYTNKILKGIILVMLVAGSETTATTMEWTVSLLLNHPETMNKVRAEIDAYVGQDELLNESDSTKLKYLQNVITETLRLYPVAPLLIPHESSKDCKVGGFDIPAGTMLLVNLWTLHRDAKWWEDPTKFVPERFDEGGGDQAIYNMIPFGAGRRSCPGSALAKRAMLHALGVLIQCFDLDTVGGEEINMMEGTGITLPKLDPLVALCTPRPNMIKLKLQVMEIEASLWVIIAVITLLFFLFLSKSNPKNLPPTPPSLPLIGHLHLIKEPLHRSLHNLTQKHGPTISLRLGKRNVLVVSSPSAVEECFTKNDITFANRPQTIAAKHLNYNSRTVGFANYGDYWRNLRRLTTLQLFSSTRLAMFSKVREDEVKLMVKQLFQENKHQMLSYSKVELRSRFVELSFNIMVRMISGKRYYGVEGEVKEFEGLMKEFVELMGNGNLNDFFPVLRWVDFQGVERKMVEVMKRLDGFLQKMIDEQVRNRGREEQGNDATTLIDVMLDLQQTDPEFFTHETVKGVVLAMLVAGSETSANTMEWALSLLLNHPEAMNKVRGEIESYVGQDELLNESNSTKVKYLQNVITETLRLYPVVPLLLPHESSKDCVVDGYEIPEGTMLLVNLWTLHRDANSWVDPTRFVPERFEGVELGGDIHQVYNMIPFGAGRRACPGSVLAKRFTGHALGALIQCFEWDTIEHQQIDMTEGAGITMPKLEPLVALCRPRHSMIQLLSNM